MYNKMSLNKTKDVTSEIFNIRNDIIRTIITQIFAGR